MSNKKFCVIIPVHNEAQTVGSIVQSIKGKGIDVVIIDDGSTDHSGEKAQQHGANVVRHDEKKGKGFSLRDGFSYALSHGYEGVITMDGDGQHSIDDLDHFVEKANLSDVCIINGNRMEDVSRMPFVRHMTNRFMSGLISLFAKQRIPDTQCGYKYISCEILRNIQLESNDFEIETEVLMKAAKKGYKVYSLGIKTIYGNEKSKIDPLKDTMRFIAYFFKEIIS